MRWRKLKSISLQKVQNGASDNQHDSNDEAITRYDDEKRNNEEILWYAEFEPVE